MKTQYQTVRSSQPALGPNDPATQNASLPEAPYEITHDMAYYLRRSHEARSEAFHGGFAFLADAVRRTPEKVGALGDRIHAWLFTPFYSGGQKS